MYALLLRFLPRWFACLVLVMWYVALMALICVAWRGEAEMFWYGRI